MQKCGLTIELAGELGAGGSAVAQPLSHRGPASFGSRRTRLWYAKAPLQSFNLIEEALFGRACAPGRRRRYLLRRYRAVI
jgi:hypothetical protein